MEYSKYDELYKQTVERGTRAPECQASEEEWSAFSEVSQESIIQQLEREVAEFIWD